MLRNITSPYPDDPYTLSFGKTVLLNKQFDVSNRLRFLRTWDQEATEKIRMIGRFIDKTKDNDLARKRIADQLARQIPRLMLHRILEPLEIDDSQLNADYINSLRECLVIQYAAMPRESKHLWMRNFDLIMTSDYRQITDEIKGVCRSAWSGHQMNYLLGGDARMGKTLYIDWLQINNMPKKLKDRNLVQLIIVEAPQRASHQNLYLIRDIVSSLGTVSVTGKNEDELKVDLTFFAYKCRVKMIIADEIHRYRTADAKHGFIELSNRVRLIPIICASCQPKRFTDNEPEIQGRWMKGFPIERYTGERLAIFLTIIEILLPFTQYSFLALRTIDGNEGPSAVIERLTDGRLGFIMWLLREATATAIDHNMPCLNTELLINTWNSRPVKDPFFDLTDEE